ncbi:MAG: EAL domain-containing protein [Cyanobacteria bacterium SID2]|nr:EAL domain-containing protein [Cyanobacteria bacterium SID2]MBP0005154.1 EAL domain-containing protein [Cyanobacteria bacterium SBC]
MTFTSSCILVVDDESELERLVKQRFRKQIRAGKFEFHFASNGVEALEHLQNNCRIDAVLTDLKMPKMDGLAFLEQLPEIDPHLKAIVISAYGDLPNLRAAMNRGAFDFLMKPLDFRDLEITIEKTVNCVRQSREQQHSLENALDRLKYYAYYDRATGLPNESWLLERIRSQIEERCGDGFAVMFVHFDGLRTVKYGLGHTVSEHLSRELARRLESCIRPTDTLARISANEFAILLPDIEDVQLARQMAGQIDRAFRNPFYLNGAVVFLIACMGIAEHTLRSDRPEDFLRAADLAMHDAKVRQEKLAWFDDSMQSRVSRRLQLEADLKTALEKQQLSLRFQPIVSLATGELVSFEVLARWHHPTQGWISPSEFVPVAEETGLIIPLGKWVLAEACRQLCEWRSQCVVECDLLSISVNLSGIQLGNTDILDSIEDILQSTGLNGSNLKIEITESILMEKVSNATDLLELLKGKQVQLSIDDFGTGYSCLSYLQSFPIDTLKIDRTFIQDIESNRKSLDIARTIVNLAHSLELDVVAEGIENQLQLDILRSLSCDYGQGFFFAKPLDKDAAIDFMKRHTLFPNRPILNSESSA